nr:hypothetical protein [Propionivibrio soli]
MALDLALAALLERAVALLDICYVAQRYRLGCALLGNGAGVNALPHAPQVVTCNLAGLVDSEYTMRPDCDACLLAIDPPLHYVGALPVLGNT